MGRPKGSKNIRDRVIPYESLNPPILHKGDAWTEKEAVAEMEFLVRCIGSGNPKLIFPTIIAHGRGYAPTLHKELASKFPSCEKLFKDAEELQRDVIKNKALTKEFDARFSQFAMINISQWRSDNRAEIGGVVIINTKDFKNLENGNTPEIEASKIASKRARSKVQ
jgi:hypothetical protein